MLSSRMQAIPTGARDACGDDVCISLPTKTKEYETSLCSIVVPAEFGEGGARRQRAGSSRL